MIFDAHCDTATLYYRLKKGIEKDTFPQVSFDMMEKLSPIIQTFAFFMDPDCFEVRDLTLYHDVIDFWDVELRRAGVVKCNTRKDIESVADNFGIGAIYSLEGMDFFDYIEDNNADEKVLKYFFDKGIKFASLTWNHANVLASGVETMGMCSDVGLTNRGKKVVHLLNKHKIIPDVSHASVKTFYDICEESEGPVIATHSNAFSLCENIRNLNDEQLKLISHKSGFVGINLYPPFLNDGGVADMDDVIRHAEYLIEILGEDSVGLGCDFDGVECLPKGISCISNLDLLKEYFICKGWKIELVDKLFGINLQKFVINNCF